MLAKDIMKSGWYKTLHISHQPKPLSNAVACIGLHPTQCMTLLKCCVPKRSTGIWGLEAVQHQAQEHCTFGCACFAEGHRYSASGKDDQASVPQPDLLLPGLGITCRHSGPSHLELHSPLLQPTLTLHQRSTAFLKGHSSSRAGRRAGLCWALAGAAASICHGPLISSAAVQQHHGGQPPGAGAGSTKAGRALQVGADRQGARSCGVILYTSGILSVVRYTS